METEQATDTKKTETIVRMLKTAGRGLARAGRPVSIAFLVLLAVWFVGRIVEATDKTTVFDPYLIYWMGASIWLLLSVWVIGYAIASARDFAKSERKKWAMISWIFFLVAVSAIVFGLEGFRISSSGLFAALNGSAESSNQASFLLFKFHPLNPMLEINLLASKVRGWTPDIKSLGAFVWSWNIFFAFFVWSLVYGIVLLLQKDKIGTKTLHLFFAAGGLTVLIIMKAASTATQERMMFFQGGTIVLFVFQVLLTYSVVRGIAAEREEIPDEKGDFAVNSSVENRPAKPHPLGLPPSSIRLALLIFLMVPILADLQGQFQLAPPSVQIMKQLSKEHNTVGSKLVTVTPISVHTGPAIGDDLVGVLPKGTQVSVLAKKCRWVRIGQNKWVSERFLRPVEKKSHAVTLRSGRSRPAS